MVHILHVIDINKDSNDIKCSEEIGRWTWLKTDHEKIEILCVYY